MILRYSFVLTLLALASSCLSQGLHTGRSVSSSDDHSLNLEHTLTQEHPSSQEDHHPPSISLDYESVTLMEDGEEKIVYVIIKDKDSPLSCQQLKSSPGTLVSTKFSGSPPYCKLHLYPLHHKFGSENLSLIIDNGKKMTKDLEVIVQAVDDPPEIFLSPSKLQFMEDSVSQFIEIELRDVDDKVSCDEMTVSSNNIVDVKISGTTSKCQAQITPLKNKFGAAKIIFHYLNGQPASALMDIDIQSIDDPPELFLEKQEMSFNEDGLDQELSIRISDVDSEVDCSELSAPGNDLVSVFFTGESPKCFANIIPKTNQSGEIDLPIQLQNNPLTAKSLHLKVVPVDDPPQIMLSKRKFIFNEDDGPKVLAITLNDVDSPINCSQIKFKSSQNILAPLMVVGSGNFCSMNITPLPEKSGKVDLTLFVDNGLYAETSFNVVVRAIDDPPVIEWQNQNIQFKENGPSQFFPFKILDLDSPVNCSGVQVKGDTHLFNTLSVLTDKTKNCVIEFSPKFNTTGEGFIQLEYDNGQRASKKISFIITPNLAAPTSLALIDPAFSPHSNSTPTIRVSPVRIGETIKLFKDKNCKFEIASGIATDNEFIDLTTIALEAGSYDIHAMAKDSYDSTSECSKNSVHYTFNVNANFEFLGLNSITEKTDSTVTLHWTPHPQAVSYSIYDTLKNQPLLLKKILGQGEKSITLVGLTPFSTYRFRVKMQSKEGFYDDNFNDFSVTMNGAPHPPSSLQILNHEDQSTVLRVSGVKEGDVVKIFSNHHCTDEVAAQEAKDQFVDVRLPKLSDGVYHFYATSTNKMGSSSTCSSSTVSYQQKVCPPQFIEIKRNRTLGTFKNFCVAKFEMTNSHGKARSLPGSTPWTNISIEDAQKECQKLGPGFDLISNSHWMTIAYEIEENEKNWIKTSDRILYKGHTDSHPAHILSTPNDENDVYFQTQNSIEDAIDFGVEQRRTFHVNKDQVIWDFSGNAWEWVNWVAQKNIIYPTKCDSPKWTEIKDIACQDLINVEYLPLNPFVVEDYNSSQNLGKFMSTGSAPALRGGKWSLKTASGIYSLYWNEEKKNKTPDIGFRCIFTPEEN